MNISIAKVFDTMKLGIDKKWGLFAVFVVALFVALFATTSFASGLFASQLNNLSAEEEVSIGDRAFAMLGIGIAFGLAALGAGIGIYGAGSAGISAIAERPEISTMAIIITALAEAIAIYGIVVVILMLSKI